MNKTICRRCNGTSIIKTMISCPPCQGTGMKNPPPNWDGSTILWIMTEDSKCVFCRGSGRTMGTIRCDNPQCKNGFVYY